MTILDQTTRNEILRLLNDYFSEGELRELCFELSIDYENLPGQTKRQKIIGLISFCERHGRISILLRMCRRLRPFIDWPPDPESTVDKPNVPNNLDIEQPKPEPAPRNSRSNRGMLITVVVILCLCCALYGLVIVTINDGCLFPPPINNLLPSSIIC